MFISMAVMMGNLYSALRAAGAEDEVARKAAEGVANYENRIAKVEASTEVLKWMVGVNIALTIATLGILLRAGQG